MKNQLVKTESCVYSSLHYEPLQPETDEALRKSERRFQDISQAAGEYIWEIDSEGRYTFLTRRIEDILGYSAEEIIGTSPFKFMPPLEAKRASQKFIAVAKNEESFSNFELRSLSSSGETVWLAISGLPLFDQSGLLIGYRGAGLDITERKRRENEVIEAKERAESLNAQLAEEMESKSKLIEDLDAFSQTVAHDLKAPLNSMVGFSKILKDENATLSESEKKEFSEIIYEASNRMTNIIDELLLLASVRQQSVPLTEVNMVDVIERSISRMQFFIDEANASIEYQRDLPCIVGYAPWLEEVWTNFISNGLKYGGCPPKVEIGADELENDQVRFWIKDNGGGISQEDRERLFKPFSRLGKEKVSGHGLGLSIIKKISEKLNAELGVESNEKKGATFYFALQRFR